MVAHYFDFLRKFCEKRMLFEADGGAFAVDGNWCANNAAAVLVNDALMAEANAKDGDFAGEFFDHWCANAKVFGVFRCSWAGRNNDVSVVLGDDCGEVDGVVADDCGIGFEFSAKLVEVVGEGIEIVEN